MSNIDYYLMEEKEEDNSKCGMIDLEKCMESDENLTSENVFPTSTSTELTLPTPDNGLGQEDKTSQDTANFDDQKQIIGSSDDQIMSFITTSQEEVSTQKATDVDTEVEQESSICESSENMFKSMIDMGGQVHLQADEDEKPLDQETDESTPDEGVSHFNETTPTISEESANLTNTITIDNKVTKSLDEILDNFCPDEQSNYAEPSYVEKVDADVDIVHEEKEQQIETEEQVQKLGSVSAITTGEEDMSNASEEEDITTNSNPGVYSHLGREKMKDPLGLEEVQQEPEETVMLQQEVYGEEVVADVEMEDRQQYVEESYVHTEETVVAPEETIVAPEETVVAPEETRYVHTEETSYLHAEETIVAPGDTVIINQEDIIEDTEIATEETGHLPAHENIGQVVESSQANTEIEVDNFHEKYEDDVEEEIENQMEEKDDENSPENKEADQDMPIVENVQVPKKLVSMNVTENEEKKNLQQSDSDVKDTKKKDNKDEDNWYDAINNEDFDTDDMSTDDDDDEITKKDENMGQGKTKNAPGQLKNKRTFADAEENIRKKLKKIFPDDDSDDIDGELEEDYDDEMLYDDESSDEDEGQTSKKSTKEVNIKTSMSKGITEKKTINGVDKNKATSKNAESSLQDKNAGKPTTKAPERKVILAPTTKVANKPILKASTNLAGKGQVVLQLKKANFPASSKTISLASFPVKSPQTKIFASSPTKSVTLSPTKSLISSSTKSLSSSSTKSPSTSPTKILASPTKILASPTKILASPTKILTSPPKSSKKPMLKFTKVLHSPKKVQEPVEDIDFDEESIENISRTIRSFTNEKTDKESPYKNASQKAPLSTQKVNVGKAAPNVEKVKKRLEKILEKSKGEEDAAIAELQKMKKEKTDILNAITIEMEKLKAILVKDKQG